MPPAAHTISVPEDDDRSDDDDARENVGIRGADADDENPIRALILRARGTP